MLSFPPNKNISFFPPFSSNSSWFYRLSSGVF